MSSTGSHCVLIIDCPACVDPEKANAPERQADGIREWTAAFEATASTNAEGWCWWPVEGESALRCPDCGSPGRIWNY
jgi:hypothetical protein